MTAVAPGRTRARAEPHQQAEPLERMPEAEVQARASRARAPEARVPVGHPAREAGLVSTCARVVLTRPILHRVELASRAFFSAQPKAQVWPLTTMRIRSGFP